MYDKLTANQTTNTGEIILYQPDNSLRLEVRMEVKRFGLIVNNLRYYLIEMLKL